MRVKGTADVEASSHIATAHSGEWRSATSTRAAGPTKGVEALVGSTAGAEVAVGSGADAPTNECRRTSEQEVRVAKLAPTEAAAAGADAPILTMLKNTIVENKDTDVSAQSTQQNASAGQQSAAVAASHKGADAPVHKMQKKIAGHKDADAPPAETKAKEGPRGGDWAGALTALEVDELCDRLDIKTMWPARWFYDVLAAPDEGLRTETRRAWRPGGVAVVWVRRHWVLLHAPVATGDTTEFTSWQIYDSAITMTEGRRFNFWESWRSRVLNAARPTTPFSI